MRRPRTIDDVALLTELAAAGGDPEPLQIRLRDGTLAILRPISASDKGRLQRGLQLLSPRSRRLRCSRAAEQLSERELRYLTEVDHRDHVEWVALDPAHPELPGMGIGGYVRSSRRPDVAEAALTVVDHYQGRGLGTLLLAAVMQSARANGVRVLRNYVRADNATMLEVFDQLGATRRSYEPGLYEIDLPLPDDPEALPPTPAGRAIHTFATQQHHRSHTILAAIARWFDLLRRRADAPSAPPNVLPDIPDAGRSCHRERGMLADWLDATLQEESRR
jgi:GNAT superfamily N-acetyltransferase